MLACGSCVESFNSSVFIYRDAQSRLVCNPAVAQSPPTSHSKDNLRQETFYHPCHGDAPSAGADELIPLTA